RPHHVTDRVPFHAVSRDAEWLILFKAEILELDGTRQRFRYKETRLRVWICCGTRYVMDIHPFPSSIDTDPKQPLFSFDSREHVLLEQLEEFVDRSFDHRLDQLILDKRTNDRNLKHGNTEDGDLGNLLCGLVRNCV